MVLPIYKVLSLVIRVFSKPLVTYTKQAHLKNGANTHPHMRKAFISLGNTYNKTQTWINRKFMKIETQFAYKPLNDELALEKGIEFFYEIIFYSIVIGLPLYEMMRASNQAKAKSVALQQKLKRIDENLQEILKKEKEEKVANDTNQGQKSQKILQSKSESVAVQTQTKIQKQQPKQPFQPGIIQNPVKQQPIIVINKDNLMNHQAITVNFPDQKAYTIHLYYNNPSKSASEG